MCIKLYYEFNIIILKLLIYNRVLYIRYLYCTNLYFWIMIQYDKIIQSENKSFTKYALTYVLSLILVMNTLLSSYK